LRKSKWLIVIAMVVATLLWTSGVLAAPTKTLTFWTCDYNPDINDWLKEEVFPRFEEQFDCEVQYVPVPWDQRSEKLLTAFAGGQAPDIYGTGHGHAFGEAARGMLRDITPLIEQLPDIDDFYDVVWEPSTYKGRIYGVPLIISERIIMYWKDVFAEVGLDPEAAPQSWEDIRVATEKTTKVEGSRLERMGYQPDWGSNFGRAQAFSQYIKMNDGRLVSEDLTKPVFAGEEGLETLTFLVELYNLAQPKGVAPLTPGVIPHFSIGKIAMQRAWSGDFVWNVVRYAPDKIDDVGFFTPRKTPTSTPVAELYINGLAISSQAKDPQLAWEFVKFLISPENMHTYNRLYGSVSPRKSEIDSDWVQKEWPQLLHWYDAMECGQTFEVMPEDSKIQETLGMEIEYALYGEKTPKKALDDAAAKIANILAETDL
jgi:multiple sugar transport system substrate-binding protein